MEQLSQEGYAVCETCLWYEEYENDQLVALELIEQCGECLMDEVLWQRVEVE